MACSGLKRKDTLDKVGDDFSEFSLSSPPTKIRRLDVDLSPIAEIEEEMESDDAVNEERALVVFNPLPSPFSFTLHSQILPPIHNNWSEQYESDCDRLIRSQEEEEKKKQSLAIVPWVSSSSCNSNVEDSISNKTNTEEADEEIGDMDMEIEEQNMDSIANINSSSTSTIHPLSMHYGVSGITPEGFHQWQQHHQHQQQQLQHCFLPQFPQNTSTPITWTR